MLNFLPGPVLFMLSLSLLIINTAVWGSLISIGGVVKLVMPAQSARNAVTAVMNRFMWAWACCNGGILFLIAKIEWDVEGLEGLDKNSWYLLISNHLSGFDIAAQTYVLRNHIPMLKFFLKRELAYVPIMGLGCWALDMPFMNRTSPAKLKKNPKLKGKDLATTRRACEKFKICLRQSLTMLKAAVLPKINISAKTRLISICYALKRAVLPLPYRPWVSNLLTCWI